MISINFQNTEIATLEEGAHIRQVTESLESTLQVKLKNVSKFEAIKNDKL